jgi:anti-sigma B factor antagonist
LEPLGLDPKPCFSVRKRTSPPETAFLKVGVYLKAPSRAFRLSRLGFGQTGNGFVERDRGEEEFPVSTTLSFREVGDVTVIDVAGQIKLGEGAVSVRDAVRQLVGRNQKRILVNLGEVTYIDSSGIGELVAGFTTVTNQGGQLKLLNLTKRVQDLLQITKLYTVFEVYDNEAQAIRSFSSIAATA